MYFIIVPAFEIVTVSAISSQISQLSVNCRQLVHAENKENINAPYFGFFVKRFPRSSVLSQRASNADSVSILHTRLHTMTSPRHRCLIYENIKQLALYSALVWRYVCDSTCLMDIRRIATVIQQILFHDSVSIKVTSHETHGPSIARQFHCMTKRLARVRIKKTSKICISVFVRGIIFIYVEYFPRASIAEH